MICSVMDLTIIDFHTIKSILNLGEIMKVKMLV